MSFSIFASRLPQEYQDLAYQEDSFCHAALSWLSIFKLDNVKNNTFMGSCEYPVRLHLIPYFGAMKTAEISSSVVQAYFKEKKSQFALESLRRHRYCLKSIFDIAVDDGCIVRNPVTRRIKLSSDIPPIEKKTWSQEEAALVWSFARKHKFGIDIMTLMETAISRSELLGLTWQDHDEKRAVLSIRNGLVVARNPYSNQVELIHDGLKNRFREREIPLSKELNAALCIKRAETEVRYSQKYVKHIFHAPEGGAYYPDSWYKRVLKEFMKSLNERHPEIPMLTTHELRHTRASVLINGNKNIFSVAALMGHGDLNMLRERYVHPDMNTMRENLGL